jgi:hypothetical protein
MAGCMAEVLRTRVLNATRTQLEEQGGDPRDSPTGQSKGNQDELSPDRCGSRYSASVLGTQELSDPSPALPGQALPFASSAGGFKFEPHHLKGE